MADSILLTVQSQNGKNLTSSVPKVFEVSKLGAIEANLNPATSVTVTPNSALGTSAWALYFAQGLQVPSKLYFTVTDNGTDNTVKVYSDSNLTNLVAQSNGVIADGATGVLLEKNESGITGKVTVAAGSNSGNSYLTITGFTASKGLSLSGATQFSYTEEDGVTNDYTVTESVSAIQTAISGADATLTAEASLTTAQILTMGTTPVQIIPAAPTGYVNEFVSGIVVVTCASTAVAYATNTDVDLQFTSLAGGTTGVVATAATALAYEVNSGTAIYHLTPVAGISVTADSISITDVNGNPATGTGSIKVIVNYKVTAI